MERDVFQSLLGKRWMPSKSHNVSSTASRSRWLSDAADLVVLLCSLLFTTASLVLVGLISSAVKNPNSALPIAVLSFLQRGISALSTTITSAVIMVTSKRYILFKLERGGIRSRKASALANPSVGNLVSYLALRGGFELPLLALFAVWALALATGLTANDCWGLVAPAGERQISVPFGPLDVSISQTPMSSWVIPASQQLTFVVGSLCLGVQGVVGLIETPGVNVTAGGPAGAIYYPPLPYFSNHEGFSLTTALNGFILSIEQLSSLPSTAQRIPCVSSAFGPETLWSDNSDDGSLSIVSNSSSLFRYTATAVVMGGTLSSTGNSTEFTPNGTWWPNTMSNNQWATDITSLICNTSLPSVCIGSSLMDLSVTLNPAVAALSAVDQAGMLWSTILGLAMGAYSSAMWPHIGVNVTDVPISADGIILTPRSGVYVLIVNIVVSVIMLAVTVRLRMGSGLGTDFLNPIRLLLDPLKNPDLFDASLDDTIDSFANPYLQVRDSSQFLVVEGRTRNRNKETDSVE